jgi:SAM-dependent methyltransferase
VAWLVSVVSAAPQAPARTPDVFFTAMPHAAADEMLAFAGVTRDDVVYDLGSGDGRIVIIAAQKYGARGVGVEIDPALVRIARQVASEGGVSERTRFVEGDLFDADLSDATVVTLWLSPGVNRALEAKLRRELRPGARVVSRQFLIGTWPPDRQTRIGSEEVFLWSIPAR